MFVLGTRLKSLLGIGQQPVTPVAPTAATAQALASLSTPVQASVDMPAPVEAPSLERFLALEGRAFAALKAAELGLLLGVINQDFEWSKGQVVGIVGPATPAQRKFIEANSKKGDAEMRCVIHPAGAPDLRIIRTSRESYEKAGRRKSA